MECQWSWNVSEYKRNETSQRSFLFVLNKSSFFTRPKSVQNMGLPLQNVITKFTIWNCQPSYWSPPALIQVCTGGQPCFSSPQILIFTDASMKVKQTTSEMELEELIDQVVVAFAGESDFVDVKNVCYWFRLSFGCVPLRFKCWTIHDQSDDQFNIQVWNCRMTLAIPGLKYRDDAPPFSLFVFSDSLVFYWTGQLKRDSKHGE